MSNRFKGYKYLVLISSFLIMGVEFSLVNSVSSLFIDPVTKQLEISNSAFPLFLQRVLLQLLSCPLSLDNFFLKSNLKQSCPLGLF